MEWENFLELELRTRTHYFLSRTRTPTSSLFADYTMPLQCCTFRVFSCPVGLSCLRVRQKPQAFRRDDSLGGDASASRPEANCLAQNRDSDLPRTQFSWSPRSGHSRESSEDGVIGSSRSLKPKSNNGGVSCFELLVSGLSKSNSG